MYKSDYAREICSSDLSLDLARPEEEEEEEQWVTHHKFKKILEMTERTIGRAVSSSHLPPRRPSQYPPEDPVSRLELENHRLRRQLELVGRSGRVSPDIDTKFSSLASEVVRLQNTVSQMEQSKMFYESSTRKLVNILESLSTQLTVPCATRHCPDTDSFDSVLSRRSSEHSSLLRGPPTPSSQTREDENISFDCGDVGGTSSLYRRHDSLHSLYRKHDSLHSILPPPPPQLAQNRSRILMGSSSVRRAMSNRTANENAKSFVAIGEEVETAVGDVEKEKVRKAYNRSKSVASGLPRLAGKVEDLSLRKLSRRNPDNKGLSRNPDNKGLSKFFKQMKSFVSKDGKLRKSKNKDDEEDQDQLNSSSSLKFRHQSQVMLTPRKLSQVQHHSTPRLIKDV